MIEESPHLKKMDSIGLPTVRQESPDKNISQSLERSNITDEINIEE